MSLSRDALLRLMDGTGSHVPSERAVDGLDEGLASARPEGWPHTCHGILLHMVYWQDLFLARMDDGPAPFPRTADVGWPAPGRNRWSDTVSRFRRGLAVARDRAMNDDLSETLPDWKGIQRSEGLAILAQHNSYHLGQIVVLRRVLGAWPPPGGGDTW